MINNRISVLVEHSSQMGLCHGHANCHAHACAQRACGGLNAYCMAILRMSRCQGIHLTEIHHILFCKAVAEKMKQGIQQCGAMAS